MQIYLNDTNSIIKNYNRDYKHDLNKPVNQVLIYNILI